MMNEDLIRKIEEEGKAAPVPSSLTPEAVRQMLEEKGSQIREEYKDDPDVPAMEEMPVVEEISAEEEKVTDLEEIRRRALKKARRRGFITAASLLAAGLLLFTGVRIWQGSRMGSSQASGGAALTEEAAEVFESPAETGGIEKAEKKAAEAAPEAEPLDYLTPAADYEAVYEALKTGRDTFYVTNGAAGGFADAKGDMAVEEAAAPTAEAAAGGYSQTNVREEGVGESDVALTDGSYIYTLGDDETEILITSAEGGDLERVSRIRPDLGSGSIREFYLQGDHLILLASYYKTSMAQTDQEDMFSLESVDETHVISYDISDREKPVETGTLKLDGYYRSTRFYDGYAYILTSTDRPFYAALPEKYEEETFTAQVIPKVNGAPVPAGAIYCPPAVSCMQSLTVTGMDLKAPGEASDAKVFMGWTSDFYASRDALYLEIPSWKGGRSVTDIVKVSYEKGKITPSAVGTVPGTLESSFSIDQSRDGYLRAAVTARSDAGVSSGVYIFDRDLVQVGSLTGLAPGEEIQSARFLEDILYLVTFRNTDPLFSVDLSDPEEPRLLGELKIPGFSDYLHFWGEDSLLGIGWDADEKNGEILGLKLSMFDISDPLSVSEITTLPMKNYWQCDGLYDYRMLLVDPAANLIGFEAGRETEEREDSWRWKDEYHVFSFEDGKFEKLASLDLEECGIPYGARGLYIGDTFYLAGGRRILAFDMEKDFEKIGEIR